MSLLLKQLRCLLRRKTNALHNLNVNDVKTDYAPGEAPRATATTPRRRC